MLIIPAIDLRTARVVRLRQGDFTKETFYSGNAVEIAKKWEREGAKLLHIVDLDGAFTGESKNLPVIEEIHKAVNIPIEVGGGLRTDESVESMLAKGIKRAIIGTRAYNDEEFLNRLLAKFKERIVVSIDAAGKSVLAEGWSYNTDIDSIELAKKMESLGVKTIIYTNVLRDGTLERPQIEPIQEMLGAVKIDVIVSGGITSIQDIIEIKGLGGKNLAGLIIGKALYEEKINLKEAVKVAEG